MDGQRFDNLARALARHRTRRQVLRGLAGGALGGLLGGFGFSSGVSSAALQETGGFCTSDRDCVSGSCDRATQSCILVGPKPGEPVDGCRADGLSCLGDRNCCSGRCDPETRRCAALELTQRDPRACEPDGATCFSDDMCCNGVCDQQSRRCGCAIVPGAARQVACNGQCIDEQELLSDPDNCGVCDNSCNTSDPGWCHEWTCQRGTCVLRPLRNGSPCRGDTSCFEPRTALCFDGECAGKPQPTGTPCGDPEINRQACVTESACDGGYCNPGRAAPNGTECGPDGAICRNGSCHASGIDCAGLADGTYCTDNNPCTYYTSCRQGECVGYGRPNGTPCGTDGEICQDQVCGSPAPCTDDGACAQWLICLNGLCGRPRQFGEDCIEDRECAGTLVCQDAICRRGPGSYCYEEGGECAEGLECCGDTGEDTDGGPVGLCADTQTDNAHCGACDNGCGSGEECVAGVCQGAGTSDTSDEPECGPGTNNECDEGLSCCNGRCADIDSDPGNCGTCGNGCPVTSELCREATCVEGVCGSEVSPDGTGCRGSCANGTCQGGACVGVIVEDGSACDRRGGCVANGTCADGICVGEDREGDVACDGSNLCTIGGVCGANGLCYSTAAPDGTPCGGNGTCRGGLCDAPQYVIAPWPRSDDGSGTVTVGCTADDDCGPGHVCAGGSCVHPAGGLGEPCIVVGDGAPICDEGLSCCNEICSDTLSDTLHCGTCGITCAQDEHCCGGNCVKVETNQHCGACHHHCLTGQSCCNGTCVEVATDLLNCGACGVACDPDTQTCCGGQCVEQEACQTCTCATNDPASCECG